MNNAEFFTEFVGLRSEADGRCYQVAEEWNYLLAMAGVTKGNMAYQDPYIAKGAEVSVVSDDGITFDIYEYSGDDRSWFIPMNFVTERDQWFAYMADFQADIDALEQRREVQRLEFEMQQLIEQEKKERELFEKLKAKYETNEEQL